MSSIQVSFYGTNSTMDTREEIIRFQLLLYCHLSGIIFTDKGRKTINDTELDCLTLIGMAGECDLNSLCNHIAGMKLFKTAMSARNTLGMLEEKGLLLKVETDKGNRKKVMLHPDMNIQTKGSVVVEVRSLYKDRVLEPAV